MNILIGADFVPTKSNIEYFEKGDIKHLLGEQLAELFSNADYRIFNLEIPLTDKASPISKCGPNLIAHTSAVNGYKTAGIDLLTLANNHILDHGKQGLENTLNVLNDAGINYVGVGKTREQAAKPFVFECDNKKIGVYACAEHEFSVVTDSSAGANPIDLLESPDHVASLKAQCDYVIVLYHGGKEYYRYPSPYLQKVCRKLAEKGADLVVCQHSHCIGCEEKYEGSTIVYGQGNFLFDDSNNECWRTGMLVSISDNFEISYIPLVKHEETVRLAEGDDAEKILKSFSERSKEILLEGFVTQKYSAFAEEMLPTYLMRVSAFNPGIILCICNKLSGYRLIPCLLHRKYAKSSRLAVENSIACEAHRELFLQGLRGEKSE